MIQLATKKDYPIILNLLRDSFPSDELRDDELQLKVFLNPDYYPFIFKVDGVVKAIVSVWDLDGAFFIEHFAVDKSLRNNGLGTKILNEVCNRFNGDICLEVELPLNTISKRRIDFYLRNGFFANDYPYLQPAYSKDKAEVPLMVLSYGKSLTEKEFSNFVKKVYKKVYNK